MQNVFRLLPLMLRLTVPGEGVLALVSVKNNFSFYPDLSFVRKIDAAACAR